MPLYEWECECGYLESVIAPISDRDILRPEHDCGKQMRRVISGRGLLYFEEGRGRVRDALSDKPITSPEQHKRLMKQRGVEESGNYLPKQVQDNPQSLGMKRYIEVDKKGRWV